MQDRIDGCRPQRLVNKFEGDASLAIYDRTVLTALEDVENALSAYGQEQSRLKSLADQVQASRRAAMGSQPLVSQMPMQQAVTVTTLGAQASRAVYGVVGAARYEAVSKL